MKTFLTGAFATVAALALVPAGAQAAPCKDAHGKFVKCPTAAVAATPTATASAPAMKASKVAKAKVTRTVTKTKVTKGHCRDAHGRFAKCGTPGAKRA